MINEEIIRDFFESLLYFIPSFFSFYQVLIELNKKIKYKDLIASSVLFWKILMILSSIAAICNYFVFPFANKTYIFGAIFSIIIMYIYNYIHIRKYCKNIKYINIPKSTKCFSAITLILTICLLYNSPAVRGEISWPYTRYNIQNNPVIINNANDKPLTKLLWSKNIALEYISPMVSDGEYIFLKKGSFNEIVMYNCLDGEKVINANDDPKKDDNYFNKRISFTSTDSMSIDGGFLFVPPSFSFGSFDGTVKFISENVDVNEFYKKLAVIDIKESFSRKSAIEQVIEYVNSSNNLNEYMITTTPIFVDNKMYLGTFDGLLLTYKVSKINNGDVYSYILDQIHALDLSDIDNSITFDENGVPIENNVAFNNINPIIFNLAYADGFVIISSLNGTIYIMNEKTTEIIFCINFKSPLPIYPLIKDSKIYITTFRSIECFDIETGAIKWRNIEESFYSKPLIVNDKIFVGGKNKLLSFDLENGNKYEIDLQSDSKDSNSQYVNSSPVFYNNRLYFASTVLFSDSFYKDYGEAPTIFYLYQYDLEKGKYTCFYQSIIAKGISDPIISDNKLFFSTDESLYCFQGNVE